MQKKCLNQRLFHHLMVLLRLGWLTVLSSINIVEQELNFLVKVPGETCESWDHYRGNYTGNHTNDTSESVCKRLRGSCNCFSSSPALKYKEETCTGTLKKKNKKLQHVSERITHHLSETCWGTGCWLWGGLTGWLPGLVLRRTRVFLFRELLLQKLLYFGFKKKRTRSNTISNIFVIILNQRCLNSLVLSERLVLLTHLLAAPCRWCAAGTSRCLHSRPQWWWWDTLPAPVVSCGPWDSLPERCSKTRSLPSSICSPAKSDLEEYLPRTKNLHWIPVCVPI